MDRRQRGGFLALLHRANLHIPPDVREHANEECQPASNYDDDNDFQSVHVAPFEGRSVCPRLQLARRRDRATYRKTLLDRGKRPDSNRPLPIDQQASGNSSAEAHFHLPRKNLSVRNARELRPVRHRVLGSAPAFSVPAAHRGFPHVAGSTLPDVKYRVLPIVT